MARARLTGKPAGAPAALARVKALLDKRGKPSVGVRVGVRTRGCSGLSYTLEYADAKSPGDEAVEVEFATLSCFTEPVELPSPRAETEVEEIRGVLERVRPALVHSLTFMPALGQAARWGLVPRNVADLVDARDLAEANGQTGECALEAGEALGLRIDGHGHMVGLGPEPGSASPPLGGWRRIRTSVG